MSATPRPTQVTIAGVVVIAGAVATVGAGFADLGSLHSAETQQRLHDAITSSSGARFGVTVGQAQRALQVMLMLAAASATASAILGWWALQRARGARTALSLIAPVLAISGLASGGFFSSVAVAGVVMLWLRPARVWFDPALGMSSPSLRATTPEAPPPAQPTQPVAPPHVPSVPSAPPGPPAWSPPPSGPVPSAPASPGPWPGWPDQAAAAAPPRRPRPLVWACVLTWSGVGLAFFLMAVSVVAMAAAPDQLLHELHRQDPHLAERGLTDHLIRTSVFVTGGIVMVWCLAVAVVAVLAWRRSRWAHVALVVSACVAAVACMFGSLGSALLVVPFLACAGASVLLLRPDVREWFRR